MLETQRVSPERFEAQRCHDAIHIRFVITADMRQADRIGHLLRRAYAVAAAHWIAIETPAMEERVWQRTAFAARSEVEAQVDLDPSSAWWQNAPSSLLLTDNIGIRQAGHDTEVRMRWTDNNLYLLFDCSYEHLHLRTETPLLTRPTPSLWEHDVAELFLGADADPLQDYMEFEVSPRGEWLDLQITAQEGTILSTAVLHSGFTATAELRPHESRWRAFLCIPFTLLAEKNIQELRLNLFRSQGPAPVELAWQPAHHVSFHVPRHFGYLRLLSD